jgi:CRISPR-associated protein Cmr6
MPGKRPLPRDTAEVINSQVLNNCCNLGLLLNRFQPWIQDQARQQWNLSLEIKEKKQGNWQSGRAKEERAKGYWLRSSTEGNSIRLHDDPLLLPEYQHVDKELFKEYFQRWLQLTSTYGATEATELRFILTTESKLIVGLGVSNTLEIGITLHHVYGFPFIPASAIKGITRTWTLINLANQLGVPMICTPSSEEEERKGEDDRKPKTPFQQLVNLLDTSLLPEQEFTRQKQITVFQRIQQHSAVADLNGAICTMTFEDFTKHKYVGFFQRIFGYPGSSGNVVFFDALPTDAPRLAVDVMNVHYPDYYSKQELPSDDQNPIPITFLTIDKETDFCFAVAPRRYRYGNDGNNANDMDDARMARTWLQYALCDIGVGAKTGAGYGYFQWR